MTFFTMKAPAGKGLFVGLYLFFSSWFDPFFFFFSSSSDLSPLLISNHFWEGFDKLAERDQGMDDEIKAARETRQTAAVPHARLGRAEAQALTDLLRQHPGMVPHRFAQMAKNSGVNLSDQQIKGWVGRNKKKVLE